MDKSWIQHQSPYTRLSERDHPCVRYDVLLVKFLDLPISLYYVPPDQLLLSFQAVRRSGPAQRTSLRVKMDSVRLKSQASNVPGEPSIFAFLGSEKL